MNSEVYQLSKGLLTTQDICTFAKNLCGKGGFDPTALYTQTANSDIMKSAARRQLYVHQTADLLKRAIILGATEPEAIRIASYLLVLIDSVDHSLDYKKCALDMDIPALERKYSKKDFLDLDVTIEDLADRIKSLQSFYEVGFV